MKQKQIRTIVTLVGLYVICQAIADVGATKIVQVGSITMPAGTFIFALTFTVRDMIHKRLGKAWARTAIFAAGAFNVLQAVYLALMGLMPSPVFFGLGDAWNSIFALVPAITAGSIVAEVLSEWIDTEIYQVVKARTAWPQWTRVLLSNAVSLPLDSFVFGMLAFVVLPPILGGHAMPFAAAMGVAFGQVVFKAVVTVVSLPGIYLVKDEQAI